METRELAAALRTMYRAAPFGEKSIMATLFGIRYAEDIGSRALQIAVASGIGGSYATEIYKGKKLARYVREHAAHLR